VNPAPEGRTDKPEAFEVRYRDGLRAVIVNLTAKTRDYLVAGRLKGGEIQSTCFYISLHVHSHWGFMVKAFEDLALTRKPSAPLERTLLANGMLLAGLESRRQGGKWLETPELRIAYRE
jgi:hypothetical protein